MIFEIDENSVEFIPHVTIIESPKMKEYLHGINEGHPLQKSLNLMNIPNSYFPVFIKESFCPLLQQEIIKEPEIVDITPDGIIKISVPILHISAHGCKDGFGFSDNKLLTWKELKEILLPIKQCCKNFLILCMSVCYGFNAIKIAQTKDKDTVPFTFLFGPIREVEWSSSLLAFLIFYKRFDLLVMDHLDEMKKVINTSIDEKDLFNIVNAEDYQERWSQMLEKVKSIIHTRTMKK